MAGQLCPCTALDLASQENPSWQRQTSLCPVGLILEERVHQLPVLLSL